MCLFSTLIRNPKYQSNKKNGGIIPTVYDSRVLWIPIGCGKCIECVKQKAQSWRIRLLEDLKANKNAKFITLTFSNESITRLSEDKSLEGAKGYELDNAIATLATRRFLERWRKTYKKSLRHWLVTELGHEGTENIHLHGILWTPEQFDTIRTHWKYGFIWPRPEHEKNNFVSAQTINYIIKYVTKIDADHKYYRSIILTSPGIGKGYMERPDHKTNKFKGTKTIETYQTSTGHKIALPIYWRNKIYTEEEREILWTQKLDKNERWVCGEKIKGDNNKAYWNLIEWHRQRSKALGYGNNKIDYDRQAYEIIRRKIMQERRKIIKQSPSAGSNQKGWIKKETQGQ